MAPDRARGPRGPRRRAILVHAVLAAGLLLPASTAAAESRVFELAIRGGELPEPSRVMRC